MKEESDAGVGQPVITQNEQPEITSEQYPPEDNTVEKGDMESLTPQLDQDVEKFSSKLNRR